MPIYTYTCVYCNVIAEKMIPMIQRDQQTCTACGHQMIRGIDRPGLVWSPTRNNGYS